MELSPGAVLQFPDLVVHEPGRVHRLVRDPATKFPIRGQRAILLWSEGEIQTFHEYRLPEGDESNADGFLDLNLQQGAYDLRIGGVTQHCEVLSGKKVELTFDLARAATDEGR